MEKYDDNNFEHVMFHGSQEALDKAQVRKALFELVKSWEITNKEREMAFLEIDKGVSPVLLRKINDEIRVTMEWKSE